MIVDREIHEIERVFTHTKPSEFQVPRKSVASFNRDRARQLTVAHVPILLVVFSRANLFLTTLDRHIHSVNYSCMSLTSIQDQIIRLSSTERARLIDILWESLDEDRVKEIEAKWATESEARIDAVDRGELETVDGPSALRDLRSSAEPCTR